jgi:hypothetical protein
VIACVFRVLRARCDRRSRAQWLSKALSYARVETQSILHQYMQSFRRRCLQHVGFSLAVDAAAVRMHAPAEHTYVCMRVTSDLLRACVACIRVRAMCVRAHEITLNAQLEHWRALCDQRQRGQLCQRARVEGAVQR